MLDPDHDGKMSKYNSRCENGGYVHTFDEHGLCFECNISKEDAEKIKIEAIFKKMFNAKEAKLIFDDQDFILTGVLEMTSQQDNILYIGVLEKK